MLLTYNQVYNLDFFKRRVLGTPILVIVSVHVLKGCIIAVYFIMLASNGSLSKDVFKRRRSPEVSSFPFWYAMTLLNFYCLVSQVL